MKKTICLRKETVRHVFGRINSLFLLKLLLLFCLEQNDVVRVRRSLQFGTDAPPAEPALLTSLETKTDDFMDQAHTFATPSKSNSKFFFLQVDLFFYNHLP